MNLVPIFYAFLFGQNSLFNSNLFEKYHKMHINSFKKNRQNIMEIYPRREKPNIKNTVKISSLYTIVLNRGHDKNKKII